VGTFIRYLLVGESSQCLVRGSFLILHFWVLQHGMLLLRGAISKS